MTDLDKIKACAMAMGLDVFWQIGAWRFDNVAFEQSEYNPLENSAQAGMLEGWLISQQGMFQSNNLVFSYWQAGKDPANWEPDYIMVADMTLPENRRRARVECVAWLKGRG